MSLPDRSIAHIPRPAPFVPAPQPWRNQQHVPALALRDALALDTPRVQHRRTLASAALDPKVHGMAAVVADRVETLRAHGGHVEQIVIV